MPQVNLSDWSCSLSVFVVVFVVFVNVVVVIFSHFHLLLRNWVN